MRDHIKAAAKYTQMQVVGIVGGLSIEKQSRLLALRPHIVVGTPGRLWECMQQGDGYLADLKMLLCLVIDEADRMVGSDHAQFLFLALCSCVKSAPIWRSSRSTTMGIGQMRSCCCGLISDGCGDGYLADEKLLLWTSE